MTTIQERLATAGIEVKPLGHILRDEYARLVVKNEADYTARILAAPEALAASPEVQALIAAAETRGWNAAIEAAADEAAQEGWPGTMSEDEYVGLRHADEAAMDCGNRIENAIRALKKGEHP